jgi:hypothetical protein
VGRSCQYSYATLFFEVRVPLRMLGIADGERTKIVIGDGLWPKSRDFQD